MLKRAKICVVLGLLAAIFGFTGLLKETAGLAQNLCYIFGGLALLSLLFCMFECEASSPSHLGPESSEQG
jgi:Small integral membrane protein